MSAASLPPTQPLTMRVAVAAPSMLIQDRGRPGWAHLGVGRAGAMDRASSERAARLVGNDGLAAGLEIIGGAELHFDRPTWIAVTGAPGPLHMHDRPIADETPRLVEHLRIGAAGSGLRRYLAVRGGLDVEPVLGSRSRDTLAGLGPPPLRTGDRVPIGPTPERPVPFHDLAVPSRASGRWGLWRGPRDDWFTAAALDALVDNVWSVSPRSDRTGLRLDGPPLTRRVHRELRSEPMVPGSIQVSPDGAPTVLAVDAPVTGGYPVIAVVDDADLDALAQLRPGEPLRFRWVG